MSSPKETEIVLHAGDRIEISQAYGLVSLAVLQENRTGEAPGRWIRKDFVIGESFGPPRSLMEFEVK